jgi:hypothetical protein
MKTKKMIFLCLSMAVLIFSSCKSDSEVVATGVTLDQVTLSIAAGDSATLKATVVPSGATGTATWTSSNTAIATVKNGIVKAVAKGTANIIATVGTFTATCAVTVTETTNFSASLTGTEYYPIVMDGVTSAALGTKIKADFRPDEATRFLYIWNATYNAGTCTGPNFYGEVETWVSMIVGSVGWSGAGFNIKTAGNELSLASLKAITDNPDKYYLHIGIRSKDNTVHAFVMGGQTDIKFAIGGTGFVDNGVTYPAIADFTRDGEWHEIEIPMSTLKTMGLSYNNFVADPNILSVLSGGVTGRTLDLDAVFIYKKK